MFDRFLKRARISKISHRVFETTFDIPKKDWDEINGTPDLFFEIPFLYVLESQLKDTIAFNYLIFYKKKKPVGIAVLQLIKFNTGGVKQDQMPCGIHKVLWDKFFDKLDMTVLVCGNLFTCGTHGFKFSENWNSKDAYFALSQTLRSLRQSRNTEKPSFVLAKDFWPNNIQETAFLEEEDFRAIQIDPNMVLRLDPNWKTLDDYLNTMRTKFRSRAQKVFNNSSVLEKVDMSAAQIAQHEIRIDALYLLVVERAEFKVEQLNALVFKKFKEVLGDRFRFIAYFLDGQIMAFSTMFIGINAIEANHVGIDYSVNTTYNLYQRMLYDFVDLGILLRVQEVRLGRTADTIKSCLGAVPIPMTLYVRHRNSFSNTLLKPMVELITPRNNEIRNPFKKI